MSLKISLLPLGEFEIPKSGNKKLKDFRKEVVKHFHLKKVNFEFADENDQNIDENQKISALSLSSVKVHLIDGNVYRFKFNPAVLADIYSRAFQNKSKLGDVRKKLEKMLPKDYKKCKVSLSSIGLKKDDDNFAAVATPSMPINVELVGYHEYPFYFSTGVCINLYCSSDMKAKDIIDVISKHRDCPKNCGSLSLETISGTQFKPKESLSEKHIHSYEVFIVQSSTLEKFPTYKFKVNMENIMIITLPKEATIKSVYKFFRHASAAKTIRFILHDRDIPLSSTFEQAQIGPEEFIMVGNFGSKKFDFVRPDRKIITGEFNDVASVGAIKNVLTEKYSFESIKLISDGNELADDLTAHELSKLDINKIQIVCEGEQPVQHHKGSRRRKSSHHHKKESGNRESINETPPRERRISEPADNKKRKISVEFAENSSEQSKSPKILRFRKSSDIREDDFDSSSFESSFSQSETDNDDTDSEKNVSFW